LCCTKINLLICRCLRKSIYAENRFNLPTILESHLEKIIITRLNTKKKDENSKRNLINKLHWWYNKKWLFLCHAVVISKNVRINGKKNNILLDENREKHKKWFVMCQFEHICDFCHKNCKVIWHMTWYSFTFSLALSLVFIEIQFI